jgi:hypothetical protein
MLGGCRSSQLDPAGIMLTSHFMIFQIFKKEKPIMKITVS